MSRSYPFLLAQTLAQRYAELPQVEAVALAGSQTAGVADHDSDIDLYVYVNADIPHPEELRRAIIAKNYPLPRRNLSSYRHQLERIVARNDWVSGHHRVAALLASYFDILFAVNRLLHPGEKRLAAFAEKNCKLVPVGMSR